MEGEYRVKELLLTGEKEQKVWGRDNYHILWVAGGSCGAFFHEKEHRCELGDMIIIQPKHKLSLLQRGKQTARVIWIQADTRMLKELSDDTTDLLGSFQFIPFGCAVVTAKGPSAILAKNIAGRLLWISKDQGFGKEIMAKGMLSLLLVMALRACIDTDGNKKTPKRPQFLVDSVFSFIREHLDQEITLQTLEEEFFVSHEHLSREFKKQTGQTIHRYLLTQRLELSCRYLRAGMPVSDLWHRCGFGSYSYYFQVFKRHYGMTPKQFAGNG